MTAPKPAPIGPRSTKRVVPPETWNEVENAWTHGKFATIADVAAHFKIQEKTVKSRFVERGIRRGSAIEDYNKKIQKELDKQAVKDAKLVADRIAETREEHYRMAYGISKLTWAEIITAKQAGNPFSTIKSNLASLESAMKILKLAREERFAVLGVEDAGSATSEEETLPSLIVSELSSEQIEEMRTMQPPDEGDDDEELFKGPSNVVLDGSEDEDDEDEADAL